MEFFRTGKRINFEKDYGVDVGIVIDADVLGISITDVDIGAIEHDMSPLSDLNEDQRYHANTARRMIPSNLLMTFSPTLKRLKFIPRSSRSTVARKFTGISFLILLLVIVKGEIRAVIPKIINVLNILDPTTLPMAISALPCIADMKLTTISGDEVPIPTIVRPITNSLKPNFLAMLDEPSTR